MSALESIDWLARPLWPEHFDPKALGEMLAAGEPDAFRRLYMQEFEPPEPIEMTMQELGALRKNQRWLGVKVRIGNDGETWFVDDRPVIITGLGVAGGGDDGSNRRDIKRHRSGLTCFGRSRRTVH